MYNDKPNNETHLCLLPNQQYIQIHVGQPPSPYLRVWERFLKDNSSGYNLSFKHPPPKYNLTVDVCYLWEYFLSKHNSKFFIIHVFSQSSSQSSPNSYILSFLLGPAVLLASLSILFIAVTFLRPDKGLIRSTNLQKINSFINHWKTPLDLQNNTSQYTFPSLLNSLNHTKKLINKMIIQKKYYSYFL